MGRVADVVNRCLSYGDETEWFEYKQDTAVSSADEVGEYISALSNGAVMRGESFGYLIWGIHNKTHELVGTSFVYDKDVDDGNTEPFKHYLTRNVKPSLYLDFDEEMMDGKRIVLLTIPAARTFPTSYKGERYIRIGSSKENVKKHPEAEAELFRVLNYGPPTLLNTPSRFSKLSFDQLFLYYEQKGITLKSDTFEDNLELRTTDGKYNLLAQLLSDDPHLDIQFAVFNGETKASTMYAVRNFGHMCILLSIDQVLAYGEVLNIPQADERERKVERKEVMLFNQAAFREAVINAFAHNSWINEDTPMFTAYNNRIEITSMGKMPQGQTLEGFYKGRSVPVNKKLAEILIQLHISEKSGRGVPRIIEAYGKDAFEFADNAIVVTIPFNRINLGNETEIPQVIPQEIPQVIPQVAPQEEKTKEQIIIDFCDEPRGILEIAEQLGYKDRKTVHKYLDPLIEQGRIAMTVPGKPNSRNQKYVTIRR